MLRIVRREGFICIRGDNCAKKITIFACPRGPSSEKVSISSNLGPGVLNFGSWLLGALTFQDAERFSTRGCASWPQQKARTHDQSFSTRYARCCISDTIFQTSMVLQCTFRNMEHHRQSRNFASSRINEMMVTWERLSLYSSYSCHPHLKHFN